MNDMTPPRIDTAVLLEHVIIRGDLSHLTAKEKTDYYARVCQSVGLNPLTKPFDFIQLNGRLVLYALKAATDQLRAIHKVSVVDMTENDWNGIYVVTTKVQNAEGRTDVAKAAVMLGNLQGDALCNAIMKAETKSKRRATLSICGLGCLSEDELDTIPASAKGDTHVAAVDVPREAMKSLPKKDAKPVYIKLQAEIDSASSREWLREWAEGNAERIAILPEDWRDILRLRYQEAMLDLQNKETRTPPEGHKDEVIWSDEDEKAANQNENPTRSYPEIPKDDGLDIPKEFRRQRPPVQQTIDYRWSKPAQ
jgi:hypothetical protein